MSNLSPNVQNYLATDDKCLAPKLTPDEVKIIIVKAKKPNGLVPRGLPKKLVQKCASSLAAPVSTIFNKIGKSAVYPPLWKVEHQIAIPKVTPAESEDDLRNLSKTPFMSMSHL